MVIATIVNTTPNQKLIGYKLRYQIMDLLPNLILSVIMGVSVYAISLLPLSPLIMLAVQCAAGVAVYLLLSVITHNDNFYYLLSLVKRYLLKRK